MLDLLILGKLKHSHAFPENDVSEELAQSALTLTSYQHMFYSHMVPALQQCDRPDLARIIERKIMEYHEPRWKKKWRERNHHLRQLPSVVFELDQKYFSGRIRKAKKFFTPSQAK
jgi:hypothetical protein